MKIKILLFLSCLSVSVSAQNWFGEEAVWTYECCSDLFVPSYLKTYPLQDTLIGNTTARLIKGDVYTRLLGSGVIDTFEFEPFIAYEAQGLVHRLSESGSMDTLYHIHALPGDQWTTQTDYFTGPMYTTVMDTGTIVIANKALKFIIAEFVLAPEFIVVDTVVERIGPLNHYFLPWHTIYLAGGAGKARCYIDQDIDYYQAWDYPLDDCEFLYSSVNESAGQQAYFKVYPNPSEDKVWIEANRELPRTECRIEIYNTFGQLICRQPFVDKQSIDLGEQAAGLLMVVLKVQGKVVAAERVLKK